MAFLRESQYMISHVYEKSPADFLPQPYSLQRICHHSLDDTLLNTNIIYPHGAPAASFQRPFLRITVKRSFKVRICCTATLCNNNLLYYSIATFYFC